MNSRVFMVVFGALVVSVSTVVAQTTPTSISGGATLVFGPASTWADRGYHLQISEEFGHLGIARLRADALYSQSPGNGITRSPATERTYAFAMNAVVRPRSQFLLTPYGLVGIGMYGQNSWSTYNPGINAGVGIELKGHGSKLFVEARLHQFWRDARESPRSGRGVTLVPISLGLRF